MSARISLSKANHVITLRFSKTGTENPPPGTTGNELGLERNHAVIPDLMFLIQGLYPSEIITMCKKLMCEVFHRIIHNGKKLKTT